MLTLVEEIERLRPGKEVPQAFDSNAFSAEAALHIEIHNPTGDLEVDILLPMRGGCMVNNATLMFPLDEVARNIYSPNLKAKSDTPGSELISSAVHAGGVLYMLCSLTWVTKGPSMFPACTLVEHNNQSHRLDFHTKQLLVRRVEGLIDEILRAIRGQPGLDHRQGYGPNTYAAAVILHFEVDYFLKAFHLETHVSNLL
jgi:hypothetical protein